MKRNDLLWIIALLTMGIGSAWAQDVRYNFDKDSDFSKFKTYKWVELKDAVKVDALLDKNIKSAIDAELATKGLTKTEGDEAALYIGYQAAVNTEKQFTSYNSNWGYGGGWYRGGWYGPVFFQHDHGADFNDLRGPISSRYVRFSQPRSGLARSSQQDRGHESKA